MRDIAEPKPIVRVAGIPLIELGARQAAAAGVGRVVVVTGHRASEVEAALPGISAKTGIPVEAVRMSDWSRPNGHSVIAGAAHISGNYLLLMADHIFADPILANLATCPVPNHGVTLAIDRRLNNPLVDPDDATWVRADGTGNICEIGKNITDFNAVDCGAFLATPALAEAIGEAVASGKQGSLSDGMQWLADAGRAGTMDIGDDWWIDVDDTRAHALAEAQAPAHLHRIFG